MAESTEAVEGVQAQEVDFSEAGESEESGEVSSIDILLDMPIPVTIVMGKTQVPIQQLLQLSPGSVLKFNKPVDAPADLYLKDTWFGSGSIVVVGEKFAIKIKQIFSGSSDSENA